MEHLLSANQLATETRMSFLNLMPDVKLRLVPPESDIALGLAASEKKCYVTECWSAWVV